MATTKQKPQNDVQLLETETPQEQVDRMGTTWVLPGQYEKQLLLPLHAEMDGVQIVELDRDGKRQMLPVYKTVCGLVLGEVTLRITGDPDEVTCQACRE